MKSDLDQTRALVRASLARRPIALLPDYSDQLVDDAAHALVNGAPYPSPAPSLERRSAASGGEVATIALSGTITPRGTLSRLLLGADDGGLQGFRTALRAAVADGNVEAIVIDVDSPGGLIDLVPEACAQIRAARAQKKIVAVANTLAASAAYWIAAQADELVITPSGQVGSIGVFTLHEDFSKMEQLMGIATTLISAGAHKTEGNPYEPLSRSARAALQDHVDQVYSMFTADVAAGRGVKQRTVVAGYGRGRLVLAQDALQLGMVDRIESLEATTARLSEDPAVDRAMASSTRSSASSGRIDYLAPRGRDQQHRSPPAPRRRRSAETRSPRRPFAGEGEKPSWSLEPDPVASPGRADVQANVHLARDRVSPVTVRLTPTAHEQLRHYAGRRGGHTEEGGCAIGKMVGLGEMLLTMITGPGPDSERTATSYRPDGAHDHFEVEAALAVEDSKSLELASWHVHPISGVDVPSEPDLQAMAKRFTHPFEDTYRYRPGWCELIVTPNRTHGLERPDVAAWILDRPYESASWFRAARAQAVVLG